MTDEMRPRVLVVDDQEDVRLMFATALSLEGYDVVGAASANDALDALRGGRFDLVLTDYSMPGGTGTSMVAAARREHLLDGTPIVIVTAHPDTPEFETFDVWRKPIDLDRFLEQVRQLVARAVRPSGDRDLGGQVDLVLYVTRTSLASRQARRTFASLMKRFDPAQVTCSVVCVEDDPEAAQRDCITLTPTLVRRAPAPRIWLVGRLDEPDLLVDLLLASGVGEKAMT